jgi:predicted lipase
MKTLTLFALLFITSFSFGQNPPKRTLDPNKKTLIVEASCGQCQFKMAGKGCTLAMRIDGKSYFVENADIDEFGDAHAKEGFCNAIRKAKVQGEIVGDKFVASYFEMIEK